MKRNSAVAGLAAGIVACALLGAPEARAAFVLTIAPDGTNVDMTGSGSVNFSGLTPMVPLTQFFNLTNVIVPGQAGLRIALPASLDMYSGAVGPPNIGTGLNEIDAFTSEGSPMAFNGAGGLLFLPAGYMSGAALSNETIFANTTIAGLGLTLGERTWMLGAGAGADTFTINVVPGPVVGAGLPGLIAALGGLVAMARRRRKQFA